MNLPSIHSLVDSVFAAIGREARTRAAGSNAAAVSSSKLNEEAMNRRLVMISASEVAIRDRQFEDGVVSSQRRDSAADCTAASKMTDHVGEDNVRATDAGEDESRKQRAEPMHGNGLRLNCSLIFLMRLSIPTATNAASLSRVTAAPQLLTGMYYASGRQPPVNVSNGRLESPALSWLTSS